MGFFLTLPHLISIRINNFLIIIKKRKFKLTITLFVMFLLYFCSFFLFKRLPRHLVISTNIRTLTIFLGAPNPLSFFHDVFKLKLILEIFCHFFSSLYFRNRLGLRQNPTLLCSSRFIT